MGWISCLTRLHGTNFCTTSARFASGFVRQPNGPECTQIVRNAPKRQFRVQWGGSDASLRKIPTRLHGTNFCPTLARFAPSFVRKPNATKCTQIVRNAPKHQFRVQWGWIGCIRCKKFRRDITARTFALVRSFLHRVS